MTQHIYIYEGESVNKLQLDTRRKTYDILTCEKTLIARHILHQYWYTWLIALQVRRNPRALKSWLLSQPLPHLVGYHLLFSNVIERISRPSCKPLYPTNCSHSKPETFLYEYFCIEPFCPQETHNITLLFGSTLLKEGRHFDYWNHPLNTHMRNCYLDCHEAGLCCYLVIHI
jgi:hypothetical protein